MSFKKELKFFLLLKLLVPIGYWVLILYAKTLRVRIEDTVGVRDCLKKGCRLVMASWHQRFYGGFFIPKAINTKPCIMISRSRDGDYIAAIVSRIGWEPVRGSSSRGGGEALRRWSQVLSMARLAGI